MSARVVAAEAFVSNSVGTLASAEQFSKNASDLFTRYSYPPIYLCDLLLRPVSKSPDAQALSIRTPMYILELLKLRKIDTCSILAALRQHSKWNITNDEQSNVELKGTRWQLSYIREQSIMLLLTKVLMDGTFPKDTKEAVNLIIQISKWAIMISNPNLDAGIDIAGELSSEILRKRAQELFNARGDFGNVIIRMAGNTMIIKALQKSCPKSKIKDFSQALESFASMISNSNQNIAHQVELFRVQVLGPLQPNKTDSQTASDMMVGINNLPVVDLPIVYSRAALYIYLSSLLVSRPIVDDGQIVNYLRNRFLGNVQLSMTELISASFNVLANAILRREGSATTIVLRSFLVNRLPLLLVTLSTSTFPVTRADYSITTALNGVDTNVFPTLTSMFDENSIGSSIAEPVRQDFCFACCLHNLIPEESIERLLGETPMQTLPAGGRYLKETLIEECMNDAARLERLLDEVELMNGNVGAVCSAVVEMICALCASRDTMLLKSMCAHLARKPSSLDIILLFQGVTTILKPLCELLDGWHHDEDLGEYQPVYEEFGGILLLVTAFVYRYDLSITDLGIQAHDSFMSKWLEHGASVRNGQLSEAENNHLGEWIQALFLTEGGGLSDQPMSSCTPQEFYLLVPTLFSNIVLASKSGALQDDTMKSGIEFLTDTFLSPSLIGALLWLSRRLRSSAEDRDTCVTVLHRLLLPKDKLSGEASTTLTSVLNIVAKPLENSLRYLQSVEPQRQDIGPLREVLAPHLDFYRTGDAVHTELESWTSTAGGGLRVAIGQTIQQLVHWSVTVGTHVTPTSYTHRQILVGLKMLGVQNLLDVLINELIQHTQNETGAVALDIVTSIICAPDRYTFPQSQGAALQNSGTTRLTIQDALKLAHENVSEIYKKDIPRAEAITRMWRRVEAQNLTEEARIRNNSTILSNMADGAMMSGIVASSTRMNSLHDMGSMAGIVGMDMDTLTGLEGMGSMDGLNNMVGLDGIESLGGMGATGNLTDTSNLLGIDGNDLLDSNLDLEF